MASESITIPLDIVEIVIGYLEDEDTIRACGTVCKSWVPACRARKFRHIILGREFSRGRSPASCANLLRAISTTPGVCSYIKTLTINIGCLESEYRIFPDLFAQLTAVEILTMGTLSFPPTHVIHVCVTEALLRAPFIRTLKCFRLLNIRDAPILLDILYLTRKLEAFEFTQVWFKEGNMFNSSRASMDIQKLTLETASQRARIKHLSLDNSEIAMLLLQKGSPLVISDLESLEIGLYGYGVPRLMSTLFLSSLVNLTLRIDRQGTTKLPDVLSFEAMPLLQTFQVQSLFRDTLKTTFRQLLDILSILSHTENLRSIFLRLIPKRDTTRKKPHEPVGILVAMDELLSVNGLFPHLKNVTFEFVRLHCNANEDTSREDIVRWMECAKRLQKKGLLSVRYIGYDTI